MADPRVKRTRVRVFLLRNNWIAPDDPAGPSIPLSRLILSPGSAFRNVNYTESVIPRLWQTTIYVKAAATLARVRPLLGSSFGRILPSLPTQC
jgi:hypothetical protein